MLDTTRTATRKVLSATSIDILKKSILFVLIACFSLSLFSCGQVENANEIDGFPLTVGDCTLQKPPAKVAVLFNSAVEVAVELGAKSRLCGVPNDCDLSDITQVGTTGEPNIEKIISANPDAVITTNFTSDIALSKLYDKSIPVIKLDAPTTFEQLKKFYSEIGTIFGGDIGKDTATEKCTALLEEVDKVVGNSKSKKTAMVFADFDSNTKYPANSIVCELFDKCNVKISDEADLIFCKTADIEKAKTKYPSAKTVAFDFTSSELCGSKLIDAVKIICKDY